MKDFVEALAWCLLLAVATAAYCLITPEQNSAEYEWSAAETAAIEQEGK